MAFAQPTIIREVEQDTSPTLGGNLDANSNDITNIGDLGVNMAAPSRLRAAIEGTGGTIADAAGIEFIDDSNTAVAATQIWAPARNETQFNMGTYWDGSVYKSASGGVEAWQFRTTSGDLQLRHTDQQTAGATHTMTTLATFSTNGVTFAAGSTIVFGASAAIVDAGADLQYSATTHTFLGAGSFSGILTMDADLNMASNQINFGTLSNDMDISHNGTDGTIAMTTGDLFLTGGTLAMQRTGAPCIFSVERTDGSMANLAAGSAACNFRVDDADVFTVSSQARANLELFNGTGVLHYFAVDMTAGNIGIGSNGATNVWTSPSAWDASSVNVLQFYNGTAPGSTTANQGSIYCAGGEMWALGTTTAQQLSSHNPDTGEYWSRSFHYRDDGKRLRRVIHTERLLREIINKLGLNVDDFIENKVVNA